MKPKISPSTLKMSMRCEYMAALRLMKNPNTGKRHRPHYGSNTQGRMNAGIYFECRLTGKEPDFRDEVRYGSYAVWINRTSPKILRRIDQYADYCKRFLLTDRPHKIGEWLEWEFPDFIGHGQLDYEGWIHDGGIPPMNYEGILDIKLSGSIHEVWEFGGKVALDQFLQTPFYSMVKAQMESTDPELFHKAIFARREGNFEKAVEYLFDWSQTTTIRNGVFLVCENSVGPLYTDRKGKENNYPPHWMIQPVNVTPESLLLLYDTITMKERLWSDFRVHRNQYNPALLRKVDPDPHKCNGIGKTAESRGRCPMSYYCPYGRRAIGGTREPIDLFQELSREIR